MESSGSILEIVASVVVLILTAVIIPYLRKQMKLAESSEERNRYGTLQIIAAEVRQLLGNEVDDTFERLFPQIAEGVLNDKLSEEDIRMKLYTAGDTVLDRAVRTMQERGVDIVAVFGRGQLREWLEDAVRARRLWPGRSTARMLSKKEIAQEVRDGVVSRR